MKVFKKAIENVKPAVEVKSRRVGGSTYQVPVEVRPSRKLALACAGSSATALGRGEKTMRARLAGELLDAAENRGGADQEEGRHAPHGRSQQGVRPLSLVKQTGAGSRGSPPVSASGWLAAPGGILLRA